MDTKFDFIEVKDRTVVYVEVGQPGKRVKMSLKLFAAVTEGYQRMSRRDKRQFRKLVKEGWAENE